MSGTAEISVASVIDGFVSEIIGLDLTSSLDAQAKLQLTRLHVEYPVLAIREQSLDAESFMAFGAIFGDFEIDHHVPQFQDKDHKEVVYLTNRDEAGASDPGLSRPGGSVARRQHLQKAPVRPHCALRHENAQPGCRHPVRRHVSGLRGFATGPQGCNQGPQGEAQIRRRSRPLAV